ncbi:hypothetical protein MKZ38_000457 [Zalerion maritima]|uniref:RRM domain-containing protein n=1 Tax=Zalerion maritima TaxID=339359 RepID=A0AAD5WXQ0_9PEZI|nr:hypothetical protein MKZ38_000457 [Zalerion maritima]
MATGNTVHVTDMSSATPDQEVKDFFAFCGKISDVKFTTEGDKKSAEVIFAQPTAAKTALMLNNTQLGPNQIKVTDTSGVASAPDEAPRFDAPPSKERDSDELTQEEKPRSRIFAEYLAHGYVIGDVALQKAIDLDHKHGVTGRFMTTLTNLDNKYHATEKAKTADQNYHIFQRAGGLWAGLGSYFEKATSTPTGKKLVDFYTEGSRQVQDIHAEARRLADLKKDEHGGSAYKASGMERLFGKEKPVEETTTPAAEGSTATTSEVPPAPATAPTGAPTEAPPKV